MADKHDKLSPEDIEALSPKALAAAGSTLDAKERAAHCCFFWHPIET
jgi:hypothetical protein